LAQVPRRLRRRTFSIILLGVIEAELQLIEVEFLRTQTIAMTQYALHQKP
jgi:hypothetical protein